MSEISKTEYEVLAALWQQYPANAMQIIEQLNKEKQWHEKTVKTLLGRMVKKGAISYEKQGRTYLYSPILELENYAVTESKSLIERLFSGRIAPLVAGFAKSEQLSKQDINELKAFISDWEKKND